MNFDPLTALGLGPFVETGDVVLCVISSVNGLKIGSFLEASS